MRAIFVLGLLAETAASVFLVGFAFVTLAFSSEAHRNSGVSGVEGACQALALVIAFLPPAAVAFAAWKAFGSSAPAGMGGLLIPALALVIAAPASLGLFDLGDKLGAAQAQRARDERAAALRAAAERGERSWCELVNDDDRATSEDMRRCKESVESADDAAARRRELEYFFDRSELRSRYADQLGVTPAYYAERMPTIVPPLQPWLLEALFALALEDHALDTVEGRERLARLVGATWSLSWSAEALDAFERGPRKAIEHELETRTDWTGFGRDIRDSLVFELERVREQRIRRQ